MIFQRAIIPKIFSQNDNMQKHCCKCISNIKILQFPTKTKTIILRIL